MSKDSNCKVVRNMSGVEIVLNGKNLVKFYCNNNKFESIDLRGVCLKLNESCFYGSKGAVVILPDNIEYNRKSFVGSRWIQFDLRDLSDDNFRNISRYILNISRDISSIVNSDRYYLIADIILKRKLHTENLDKLIDYLVNYLYNNKTKLANEYRKVINHILHSDEYNDNIIRCKIINKLNL